MLKGIIWDFDGTIVDTETPQYQAWDQVFREHGTHLDPELWSQLVGTVTDLDLFEVLQQRMGQLKRASVVRRLGQLLDVGLRGAPLRAGVENLMREAQRVGMKQAIASSSGRGWIREYIVRHGLDQYLETIASADDVDCVKPDPAVYRVALQKLGLHARDCIAVEDSPHGASAAIAAQLVCVVVANPSTIALTFPVGVHRCQSLQNVSLMDLQHLVSE